MENRSEEKTKQLSNVFGDLAEARADSRRILKQLNDVCIKNQADRIESAAISAKSKDLHQRLQCLDIKHQQNQRNQQFLLDCFKSFKETLDTYKAGTAKASKSGRLTLGNIDSSEADSVEIIVQTTTGD